MLFLRRSKDLEVRLRRCLLFFSLILGLKINLHKSYLFRVDVDLGEVQVIAVSLGCEMKS